MRRALAVADQAAAAGDVPVGAVVLSPTGEMLAVAGNERELLADVSAHAEIVASGLTPVVYEEAEARAFSRVASGRPVGIHLKVDTGMSRLGVPFRHLARFLDVLGTLDVLVEGVMTHFASADEDTPQTEEQLACFNEAVAMVRARGHRPTLVHAANSAATFRHPEARFDMVRVGVALFGYAGADDVHADLRPSMRLRSRVISLRDLSAGDADTGYEVVAADRLDQPRGG